MSNKKRIGLISDTDYREIYSHPQFELDERDFFFSLNEKEMGIVDGLKSVRGKLYFILQLGIFKRKKIFFSTGNNEYNFELEYIRKRYFPENKRIFTIPSQRTLRDHKNLILELTGYRKCRLCDRNKVEKLCMELVKVSINKEFIFRKIKDHFDINKIIIPSYSFLCKIISQSLIKEQSRINNLIKRHLDKHQIEKLYQFLVSDIPKLKAEMKDFSLKEIQKEIAKVILLRDLLLDVENLVDRLRISAEGVKYYASLISHYQDYRLKKLQKNKVIVYLCCYIYVEFKKINDNLILAFIHHVSQISTQAKTYAKEEIYKNSESNRSALKGLPDILKIVLDEKNADKKFRKIQKSIYQVVPKEKLQSLRCYLSQKNLDTYKLEWGSIGSSYFKYSRYLRPILKNIEFESSLKENPLRHAIVFLKKALFEKKWPEQKDSAPLKLIPKHIRQYVTFLIKQFLSIFQFITFKFECAFL